jgi:aminoglycoside phosphotransferase (APT) family kinase protein
LSEASGTDAPSAPASPRAAAAGVDFEPPRLAAFLRKELPDLEGEMVVERIGGGQSNPTYFISFAGRRMVLRKRPPGELPPSAHDVGREYRLISALAGTPVPVPAPILFHEAPDVVGTAFYLMERIDGRIFHDATMPDLAPAARREAHRAHARALAALHAVDWRAAGLDSMARPGSFLARQVKRWGGVWPADDADAARVAAWLAANLPEDAPHAIVHGDFKFNNLIFHPERLEVVGVLDWELAAIGDPITDLATHWAFLWEMTPEEYGGLKGADLAALGAPTPDDYFRDYAEAAGKPVSVSAFHKALALLRVAGIYHGIGQRAAAGIAASADAAEVAKLDRVFLGRALAVVEAEGG